jgi:hypothetical protein
MTDFKFNANEVKANGIGGYGYQAVLKYREAVRSIVDEVVNTIGRDRLYELAVASGDKHDDFHAGSRFNSNEDLTYRLITSLANYIYPKFNNDLLTEMYVGGLFARLSDEEKLVLVVDAARDCAGADHWYTFEKQWD